MRTETLWQGERRAARMHWWRQVLDRPATANCESAFDEALLRRFALGRERDCNASGIEARGFELPLFQ